MYIDKNIDYNIFIEYPSIFPRIPSAVTLRCRSQPPDLGGATAVWATAPRLWVKIKAHGDSKL